MNSQLAINAQGLVKHFGVNLAVGGIDLQVPQGCIYGVLGPNGAGKTTTLRMLATLLPLDGGQAHVMGHDVRTEAHRVRERISLTGQFASVDEDLTGLENLRLLSMLLGFSRLGARKRAWQLLQAFELEAAAGRQVKYFSGGMRRRLDIAASIIVTPDLLFLDEPTTGLDPRSRNQVWEIVRALVAAGTTVLLTTQYLEEADQLADRIAVIDHGLVIAEGTSAELKQSVGAEVLHLHLADAGRWEEAAALLSDALETTVERDSEPGRLSIRLQDPARATRALVVLDDAGIYLSGFSMSQPSLDEVFMALTGYPARSGADEQETLA